MKAYKVVGVNNDDTFVSCRIEGQYTLTYTIDKPTLRGKGLLGICCFDKIENARAFARSGEHILLVRGTGLRRHRYLCGLTTTMDEFYARKRQRKGIKYFSMKPPKGTVFFDCVTPIRGIDLENEKGEIR